MTQIGQGINVFISKVNFIGKKYCSKIAGDGRGT